MSKYTPKTYRYIQWAKEFRSMCGPSPTCWICHKGIWLDAPKNSVGQFTLDHVVHLADGGDPYEVSNCMPAHRGCNSRRGNRGTSFDRRDQPRPAVAQRAADNDLRASRCWTGCSECRGMTNAEAENGRLCPRSLRQRGRTPAPAR